MKHVILSEDRNGAGTVARVCRRPDGSYAVELAGYDEAGRLTVRPLLPRDGASIFSATPWWIRGRRSST